MGIGVDEARSGLLQQYALHAASCSQLSLDAVGQPEHERQRVVCARGAAAKVAAA